MKRQTKYKIGSGFVPFSPCADRFVGGGYRDGLPLDEQIAAMARVEGMRGVAFDYPAQFTAAEIPRIRALLDRHGFELATLELGLYPDRKWKLGTLSSTAPGIRREAIEMSKRGLEIARELGAYDVLLWPGQDGFDYPFQVDYGECWKLLIDGIGEVAAHCPDVKIAIEYKPKEPRANCFIRNAGVLLYLLKCVDLPNVGATIDFGHSLVAGENPGEAAALLAREGKLFQVHLNDNYRDWDHDLVPGAANFWDLIEFFYWTRKLGYSGWYRIDVFPYREDGTQALERTVQACNTCWGLAGRLPAMNVEELLRSGEHLEVMRLLWDLVGIRD